MVIVICTHLLHELILFRSKSSENFWSIHSKIKFQKHNYLCTLKHEFKNKSLQHFYNSDIIPPFLKQDLREAFQLLFPTWLQTAALRMNISTKSRKLALQKTCKKLLNKGKCLFQRNRNFHSHTSFQCNNQSTSVSW